ncbi:PRD domain-containing protein [Thomasclavelia ramosa]|uniref:PRD domain-containing protein n=2 Tax=Bacillota TaxID=1239 RepID=UPI001C2C583C|nr:PRD domain-containing protein [Thomasclavelia ramosa]MBU9904714.1 PRD domain-containing protein [Thomasclavelia ramosa]
MKVIQRINNNVVICLDNCNQELVAFGKGIGFHEIPYELVDMSKIERTYYGVHKTYYQLANEIPEEVFSVASRIVDRARDKMRVLMNPNIVFTLADHINYALIRKNKNIMFNYPMSNDIPYLHPVEYEIGKSAVHLIKKVFKVDLGNEEATGIALHIIGNLSFNSKEDISFQLFFDNVIQIIENTYSICIKKNNFNYSRFKTHLHYLFKRKDEEHNFFNGNEKIFNSMKNNYPTAYECALKIKSYVRMDFNSILNDDDLLYLMLHINRLCEREVKPN